jgi:protease PrsW
LPAATDPPVLLLIAVLPVVCLLGALFALDSYKLVSLPTVMAVVALGVLADAFSYLANGAVLRLTNMELQTAASYVSPFIEEAAKAAIVLELIRRRRIGFLVDGAILGFAVGTGFSVVENLYIYLMHLIPSAGIGTWVVRGFGTAVMHGGATAICALMSVTILERSPEGWLRSLWPGLLIAITLHAAFNHELLSPIHSTAAILLILPPVFYFVFERSEKSVSDWLGKGFDADVRMLELINSGQLSNSHIGSYLQTLKERFRSTVIVDILCYLRLYTELGLKAKGMLMLREHGFESSVDAETRAKFVEMEFLEKSIGKTALRAINPMLHISHKELWQIYMIKQ